MNIGSVCIVGLDDFPVLAGMPGPGTNGESVQHVLLARAWRDLGLRVSMVVYADRKPLPAEIDGIRVIAAYRPGAGLRFLRFVHPHSTELVAALRRADADLYYQSPSGMQTGIAAWFCRAHGRKFVYRVASDVNCMPGKQLIRHWRDRKLYEYGLRRADLLAVQTHHQAQLLREHYGLASERVNMAVDLPGRSSGEKDIDVLWVSNFRPVKRPEWVLELAARLPEVKFTLAGGPLGSDGYYEQIIGRAQALPNVTCLGPVAYQDIGAVFDRARVFLNTSTVEGFPNTFLQSWIRGIPVVTVFDPDQTVRRRELGRAVGTIEEMARTVQALLRDEGARRSIGERARAFALQEYAAPSVARRYLELFDAAPHAALRNGTTG